MVEFDATAKSKKSFGDYDIQHNVIFTGNGTFAPDPDGVNAAKRMYKFCQENKIPLDEIEAGLRIALKLMETGPLPEANKIRLEAELQRAVYYFRTGVIPAPYNPNF